MASNLFSFACSVRGREKEDLYSRNEKESIYNARTRGQAKMAFIRDLDGCIADLKYTDVRARKLGKPHSSMAFVRNATYRGMPEARCGDRVKVGTSEGVIVGHNASANFDVLFDENDPQYPGLILNVHPGSLEVWTRPAGIDDNTQRICETQPYCLCAGEPIPGDEEKHAMECCCVAGYSNDCCPVCGADLILIDWETGEPWQPRKTSATT